MGRVCPKVVDMVWVWDDVLAAQLVFVVASSSSLVGC